MFKVIDHGADDTTNAVSIRRFFQKTTIFAMIEATLLNCQVGHLTPDRGAVRIDPRAEVLRDTTVMSEPERRMWARTDWAFVHQHARDGLSVNISPGGNVGERLMAVNARHYANIRAEAIDLLWCAEITKDGIDDRLTAFSVGFQPWLQTARNLVTELRLVFMDEPTGVLDVPGQGAGARD